MQLNEIMLRFGAFGLIGAHYKEMAIVTDPFTNQQTEQIGQPQPIFDNATLAQYMGQALTQAVEHNTSLQADLGAKSADVERLTGELQSSQSDAAALRETVAQLQQQLEALSAQAAPPASEPEQSIEQQPA
ncbi:Uncharacterised protein [Bordetella ansorpii]|uniref:Uncharacterized protein n=1 Tax=Bordetella ansorpii TaxID=288768 RepID=A0A157SJ48_9BORD|nr:hypothetical protein [Bordetella ansorpii]SAI70469.1 Uncharacterised protein [Bordetella ansorpii]